MKTKNVAVLASFATLGSFATGDIIIDLAGLESWDSQGAAANHIGLLAGEEVYGISWDNVVGDGSPSGVSWGNEMAIAIFDDFGNAQVSLSFFPSEGSATGGGVWGPASSEMLVLADYGIDNFIAGAFELYEDYDDGADAVDSYYQSGTVTLHTVAIPAPGALALIGAAGLVSRRRRA